MKQLKDKHICPYDDSTTIIEQTTNGCCGGYHQTIAGALLKSKYWKDWYKHATTNMLFYVDETLTIDAMSDTHFESFIEFIISNAIDQAIEQERKEIIDILISAYDVGVDYQIYLKHMDADTKEEVYNILKDIINNK